MKSRNRKAFTLVELLIVVLILGALAAIAVPRIAQSANTARRNACMTNVDLINTQIELYMAEEGVWPDVIGDVTGNTDYFPDGAPVCPVNPATPYVLNANNRITSHNHP